MFYSRFSPDTFKAPHNGDFLTITSDQKNKWSGITFPHCYLEMTDRVVLLGLF